MPTRVCEFEFWQGVDARQKVRWFWACMTCGKTSKRRKGGYETEGDARVGMRYHSRQMDLNWKRYEQSVAFYRVVLTSDDWPEIEVAVRARLGRPDWGWYVDAPATDAEKIAAYREMFKWARKHIGEVR